MAVHFGETGVRELITGVLLGVIEFPAPVDCRLNRLRLQIAAPNEEGDTLFNVKVDGVTIYASPADRPKILAGETVSESFPSIELLEGAIISVDVVAAPLGGISGLYVIVQLQDAPTVEQYIKDAYNGALDRDPTEEESDDAVVLLGGACAGGTAISTATEFFTDLFGGAEYTGLTTSDEEYVEDLYQAIQGRPSDPGGFAFWVDNLSGSTRELVLQAFVESVEHVNFRIIPWCPSTLPLSNANKIQSVAVSPAAPDDGEVLTYDESDGLWKPLPPNGFTPARSSVAHTTGSLANLAEETGLLALGKLSTLVMVSADKACRIRLYSSAAARAADQARAEGAERSDQDGLLLEAVLTALLLSLYTQDPVVILYNAAFPPVDEIYYTIANKSGSTGTVTVTFELTKQEA